MPDRFKQASANLSLDSQKNNAAVKNTLYLIVIMTISFYQF